MMSTVRSLLSGPRVLALATMLASASLIACGDDDGGMGPSSSGPSDVTIRLTHMLVFGSCEGSSGLDGTGDFIVEMQVMGPDGALALTPDPPSGDANDLYQGDTGQVVPLDDEFVLDGALADVAYLFIQFDVSERDGADAFDTRMRGTRGNVRILPNADGTWDGITEVVSMYGGSPCRIDFVVSLEQ